MGFQEKLIEGKYNYYQNDQIYCEEHFKVFREEKSHGNYTFQAELLSRVETGEFLKVLIDYELTHGFEPVNLRVKRSMGALKSTERFTVNLNERLVKYSFNGEGGLQESQKMISGKFHIAAPAFSTSMLMTQARKIDPVHRTSYNLLSASNLWSYEEPFKESTLYVELMSLDPVTIEVHGKELQASRCAIYEADASDRPGTEGSPIYISKYFQIPYLAEFPEGIRVEIEHLKNFDADLKEVFKG